MKIFLSLLFVFCLSATVQAEVLHQSGWTAAGGNTEKGDRESTGPQRSEGNKIWTPDEMKERRQDAASSSSSWFPFSSKPEATRNADGKVQIKRAAAAGQHSFWSSLFQ